MELDIIPKSATNYQLEKLRRFEIASRILTGDQDIRVIEAGDRNGPPSSIMNQQFGSVIRINESVNDPELIRGLALDRSKLVQACSRVKFGGNFISEQHEAMVQDKSPKAFLEYSSIIESGRTERIARKLWAGADDFLNLLLNFFYKKRRGNPASGLDFYIRSGKFRNKAEEKYFKPVKDLIDKAIQAESSKEAIERTKEILKVLGTPPDSLPPEPPKEESRARKSSKSEAGGDGGGGSDKDEEESDSPEGPSEGDGGEEKEEESAVANYEWVKEKANESFENVKIAVEQEHYELLNPIIEPRDQKYENSEEESKSEYVSMVLSSIMADRMRKSFTPARHSGKIDSRRIVGIRTGDSFLQATHKAEGKINVGILIDMSGSMCGRGRSLVANSCGRIINGGVQKAGIKSRVCQFGSDVKPMVNVPLSTSCMGSTSTHHAMRITLDWFQQQEESSGIMLIVTDGAPDDWNGCIKNYKRAGELNVKVILVVISNIGFDAYSGTWWDDYCNVSNIKKLESVLEEKLINSARFK